VSGPGSRVLKDVAITSVSLTAWALGYLLDSAARFQLAKHDYPIGECGRLSTLSFCVILMGAVPALATNLNHFTAAHWILAIAASSVLQFGLHVSSGTIEPLGLMYWIAEALVATLTAVIFLLASRRDGDFRQGAVSLMIGFSVSSLQFLIFLLLMPCVVKW
jgi:hypothetical protein